VSRLVDAEERLTNVLAVAPDNAFAYVVLGMLHTITDRTDLAVASFERALSLNSNLALGHSGLGLAALQR
jgi:Tfp pilus assembly protein PilF